MIYGYAEAAFHSMGGTFAISSIVVIAESPRIEGV
jgi:hypothetical protein